MDQNGMKVDETLLGPQKLPIDDHNNIVIGTDNIDFTESKTRDTQNVCRLCAQKCIDCVSIFEDNNMLIAEKIARCLPIIVLSTDELPLYICKRCLYCLNLSYKLIVNCLRVDAQLRAEFAQLKKSDNALKVLEGLEKSEIIALKEFESPGTITEKKQLEELETNSNSNERSVQHISIKTGQASKIDSKLKEMALKGPVECELCLTLFQDMDQFDNHIESVHLLNWRCNLCDKSFKTSTKLIIHKQSKHAGNINICKICVKSKKSKTESDSDIFDLPLVNEKPPSPVQTMNTTENQSEKVIAENSLDVICEICHVAVDDDDLLEGHKKVHQPKKMTCVICQTECNSVYDMFLHKRESHNKYRKVQLKFVCDLCGKFFSNSWQWENHEENVCRQKFSVHTCKYCKNNFSTNHKLTRHLRKHKKEMMDDPTVTVYKCVACPKVFVDKEFYQKHRNVHDPECWDTHKCTLCNRSFRDNVRLKEHHQSIHEGVKPHQCDVCGRTFHRLSNMRAHRIKHFGHKCPHCEEVFERTRPLASHIQNIHGLEPEIRGQSKRQYTSSCYVCRFCGKKLSTYQSVLDHEHIHTGEKPYGCNICDKKFRSYTSKWAHVQRHEKGNYVCEHCGKCFSYKQNLTTHMQIHAPIEDRKHRCSKCDKRFLRKAHLDVHMRIHNGIRPYTCDICLFNFTQLGDMKRHRARHANGEVRVRQPRTKSMPTTSNEDTN
ncbi:zinc finger protein 2 homolog [Cephus cinctus]|uniref:Zinc finger protein 2 homolog n=1 Tax=Cephus cinctus TaxID=211228 RepID=A0AAJ7FPJ0_CEPCN|nr:zinc finger protein 2 homolog [Cephus cinctus]XP_015601965.1 zinc finger protein 2 homolog [Cephus cinctus]